MEAGQVVAPTADIKQSVSEDNVAAKSRQRDKSVKGKKSSRERKATSSSKDLTTHRDALQNVTSAHPETLNQSSDTLPTGRRRVRSVDSAIFAKKRKKRMVKKQVVGVIEDLENVIYEINSVTSELRGVLNQIDRVTSHLELSVDGLDISEDNIFIKSSREKQKSVQAAKQRSASCASLATLSRYRQEINASTQTHERHESLTRHQSETSPPKDKTISATKEFKYKHIKENKRPTTSNKSPSIDIPFDPKCLQYSSQLSLASSSGRFPSNCGSLAASVSSMTGVLSSSLNSLNTGYNTSLEEIDFGISWRKRTSPGPCVTADSSYRTLSETNSLYFEDVLLQQNNNSLNSSTYNYNTNNVCTCDKEFNILGLEKSIESPSMYRQIFSTTNSRRNRSTTASISSQISCFSSEDLLKDFSADYDREINTWTTFALVHIDADELGD
ncbi:uncharacterized protein [Antedon mediterranea]|uniref:uncharacterized protein n=1 Tax=Antedon mediterranea TaxID=105859 RepID=UPI003AF720EC